MASNCSRCLRFVHRDVVVTADFSDHRLIHAPLRIFSHQLALHAGTLEGPFRRSDFFPGTEEQPADRYDYSVRWHRALFRRRVCAGVTAGGHGSCLGRALLVAAYSAGDSSRAWHTVAILGDAVAVC